MRHHAVLGHGLAVQAIRAMRAGTKVGLAENIVNAMPAIETPANIRAAEKATRELNAGYLTVMMEGRYTDAFLGQAGADAPKFTAEDLKIISARSISSASTSTCPALCRAADDARATRCCRSRPRFRIWPRPG